MLHEFEEWVETVGAAQRGVGKYGGGPSRPDDLAVLAMYAFSTTQRVWSVISYFSLIFMKSLHTDVSYCKEHNRKTGRTTST